MVSLTLISIIIVVVMISLTITIMTTKLAVIVIAIALSILVTLASVVLRHLQVQWAQRPTVQIMHAMIVCSVAPSRTHSELPPSLLPLLPRAVLPGRSNPLAAFPLLLRRACVVPLH